MNASTSAGPAAAFSSEPAQEAGPPDPAERPIYAARLRPHRSLTRSQASGVVAAVAMGLLFISLPLFLMGAWPVVGFCGLDIAGLWAAFAWSFRSARAYEDISVSPLEARLTRVTASGKARSFSFNPLWVRLEREDHHEFGLRRLALVSRGRRLEFARFLGPAQKEEVARDLAAALGEARRGPLYNP